MWSRDEVVWSRDEGCGQCGDTVVSAGSSGLPEQLSQGERRRRGQGLEGREPEEGGRSFRKPSVYRVKTIVSIYTASESLFRSH